jgi:hypothetical protein
VEAFVRSLPPALGDGFLWALEAPELRPDLVDALARAAGEKDPVLDEAPAVPPERLARLAASIEEREGLPELARRLLLLRVSLEPHLSVGQKLRLENVRAHVRRRLTGRQRERLDAYRAAFGAAEAEPAALEPSRIPLAGLRRADPPLARTPGGPDVHVQLRLRRERLFARRRPISALEADHPEVWHRLRALLFAAGAPAPRRFVWLDGRVERTVVNRGEDTVVVLGPGFSSPFGVYSAGPVALWNARPRAVVASAGALIVAGSSAPAFTLQGEPLLIERTADLSRARAPRDSRPLRFGR